MNMTLSRIVVDLLLKWAFVYSPFVNRFYQMFKTAKSRTSVQRIIRRKNEYWLSDVHHADTTTEMTPFSVRAAALHSLLSEYQ
jgi:hypothetical protein